MCINHPETIFPLPASVKILSSMKGSLVPKSFGTAVLKHLGTPVTDPVRGGVWQP